MSLMPPLLVSVYDHNKENTVDLIRHLFEHGGEESIHNIYNLLAARSSSSVDPTDHMVIEFALIGFLSSVEEYERRQSEADEI